MATNSLKLSSWVVRLDGLLLFMDQNFNMIIFSPIQRGIKIWQKGISKPLHKLSGAIQKLQDIQHERKETIYFACKTKLQKETNR